MQVAVLGAGGSVGRACIDELKARGTIAIPLHKNDTIESDTSG